MSYKKNQKFKDTTLNIINKGRDRETWDLYEYAVFDGDYLLWQGYVKSPELNIDNLSTADKKIIELNLKFKNVAKISNSASNYIELKQKSAENFIDWLLYNDDFHFRNKISFKSITILDGIEKDTLDEDSVYKATVIKKSPYGNVVNYRQKNIISILRQAYCKRKIEILALFKDDENAGMFTIEINEKGDISSIKLKYLEETLIPGALPAEVSNKLNELKGEI